MINEIKPTAILILVPIIILLRISLPNLSVPSQNVLATIEFLPLAVLTGSTTLFKNS
jgi:hypothetical protein